MQLHSFSTTTTTRLDETYYAVLEKTSALQNTITALKDLAGASREIYGTFEKESRVLEGDISGQLNALGRFDDQQNTIELLQTRIQSGRAKVQSLSGRVDIVRDHVESWERADQEWQNRTRRRLKVIWSVMFVVTVALITLFLMADFSGTKSSTGSPDMADESMTRTLRHTSLNISRVVPALDKGGDEGTGESLLWKRPREEDGRLREFDEL